MKLVLYLYRRFLSVFIGAALFFSFALLLVDLLMNLWKFILNQAALPDVLRIMLFYAPKTVWYAVPAAVLFASSYVLSDLYANNELTVIFASGISLRRFTFPLLILSLILSFSLFFFEDRIAAPFYAKKVELQNEVLKADKSKSNARIVVLSDYGRIVYKADFYDDGRQQLYKLYLVLRNEDRTADCVIAADSALWDGIEQRWQLQSAVEYKVFDDGMKIVPIEDGIEERLTEPPETFRNNTVSMEEVNTREARQYLAHLKRTGLPSAEARSVYYKKFAFPFIVFIVVFLSVGLSGKTRKNVLLVSLFLCIGAAVLFYVTQMITMLLAKFGYIPPVLGAWFPVFLFVILSAVLLKYSRT
ncbi:YjgP/YjgQ family permease [Treponema parvum]|uniref:YjgP/YjgQ family permease n=1 Tax=Treponema parvum TaxID=138851 RepID=A0A975F2X5_9SPIR|nr:LptF/LptG family permease [Treponema parvum]QTQ13655.1 YjgP/YjgQ family permease [Treponema parvum]